MRTVHSCKVQTARNAILSTFPFNLSVMFILNIWCVRVLNISMSIKFCPIVAISFWIRPVNDSVFFVGLEFKTLYIQPNPVTRATFIRHLVCSIRYSAVPINLSLLTITLCHSVKTTLGYNDTKYPVHIRSTALVSLNMQWCAMDYDKHSLFYTHHSHTLNNSPSWKVDTKLTFNFFGNDSPLGGLCVVMGRQLKFKCD